MQPATPSFLPPLPSGVQPTRLGLAKWLASPENPLTARVAVNRHWQALFGRGFVPSLEDLGHQSETPSHPGLLDWLATTYSRDLAWRIPARECDDAEAVVMKTFLDSPDVHVTPSQFLYQCS